MNPADTSPGRFWLVVNGKHAGLPALRQGVQDLRDRGHRVDVRVTWEAGDAERLAGEGVEAGAEVVAACGGDGTVNAVCNGLLETREQDRPALAVVPLGTANDFATACHLPLEMPRALQRLPGLTARPVDVGRVDGRRFINLATAGFGSRVTAETPEELKNALGGAAYFLTGLTRFSAVAPVSVALAGPEFEWRGEILMLAVGNGRRAGGGHELCPEALIDDGLLDVSILPAPAEGEWRTAITGLMSRGRSAVLEAMTRARLPWLEVEAPDGLNVNLDGEPMTGDAFRFEIEPGRLRLMLPGDSPVLRAAS